MAATDVYSSGPHSYPIPAPWPSHLFFKTAQMVDSGTVSATVDMDGVMARVDAKVVACRPLAVLDFRPRIVHAERSLIVDKQR